MLGKGLTMAALLLTRQGILVFVILLTPELADIFCHKPKCHKQHTVSGTPEAAADMRCPADDSRCLG